MTKAEWREKRNKKAKGKLPNCNKYIENEYGIKKKCNYKPSDYMDFVEHREKEHNIKPGVPDIWKRGM